MPETFRASIGGYSIIKADTTISLTDRGTGGGLALNPSDTLGTDAEQTVAKVDMHYRFNAEHSMAVSWFRVSTDGRKEIQNDFSWVDNGGNDVTVNAGAIVDTSLTYDVLALEYDWSFYHNDKVELFTSAGLHSTRFQIDLSGQQSASDPTRLDVRDVASTIPLPVIGVGLNYRVSPSLFWYMHSQFFAISLDDWKGSFSEVQFGMEYQPFEHFGVGLGVGSDTLRISRETDTYNFDYDNKLTGINMYLSTRF